MTADTAIALLTLTAMEVVLGIDNIIFIALLVGKLPRERQDLARRLGIGLALGLRLLLLFSIAWVMRLTEPLVSVLGKALSGRDLILLGGGLFLVGKATYEIHDRLEGEEGDETRPGRHRARFVAILAQILVLDLVFSLDSVITAVGMSSQLWVMVAAMVISVGVMLVASGAISAFVHRHPTMRILALSFLILIGVMLSVEGMGGHVSKGYIYFAMAFSLAVELLNIRLRRPARAVELREPRLPEGGSS